MTLPAGSAKRPFGPGSNRYRANGPSLPSAIIDLLDLSFGRVQGRELAEFVREKFVDRGDLAKKKIS